MEMAFKQYGDIDTSPISNTYKRTTITIKKNESVNIQLTSGR